MKLHTALAAVALCAHALAQAAPDPARFPLTPALLQKIKAADADYRKQAPQKTGDDDEGDDDETVEQIARKVERDPALKAVLARQGLSATDYALTVHATLHAAAFLLFEKSVDKQKTAALLAGYTPQQKANIELLRKDAQVRR